jgi:glycerol kinase
MSKLILAIDQGTTSTRAIAFETAPEGGLRPVAVSQIELAQHFPHPGWVEHDAGEIWNATLQTCREVIRKAGGVGRFAAVGITNQRETSVMWDAATGEPLHRAIVWQDRRTADATGKLAAAGEEPGVQAATGLILDPYFSASKYAWLLDAVPGARARSEAGEVKLGTIECWLIWKLTGGASHVTDATNASRTSLMELTTREWRADLCDLFGVPMAALPEIRGCAALLGMCEASALGAALPIHGAAGDQQAALESLAYQTRDLLDALEKDGAPPLEVLKVDGGVTANAWAMQFVADVCGVTVERPAFQEMTALGAAKLAALGVGLIGDLEDHPVEAPARWQPRMGADERDRLLKGWRAAVKAAIVAVP